MSKREHKNPLVQALEEGRSFTFTLSDGGNLASMRGVLKHGQSLTMSPVPHGGPVESGDIVLVKWRGGNHILHLVDKVQDGRYLIVNSVGGVNGWVEQEDILGPEDKPLS